MAQHDYIISNQGFASYRQDHNSSLSAIVSNNSGSTAPSTTYAYQWWYDESTDTLKMRNSDNDAFISMFTFDQTADTYSLATDVELTITENLDLTGSATISGDLTVDTDTLFVDASENKIAIGTTDVGTDADTKLNIFHADSPTLLFERSSGNSNGAIRVSSGGLISFLNGADTRSVDALSERMRIDSSGRTLFGTTDETPYNNTGANTGFVVWENGRIFTAINGDSMIFNRTSSDGTIIDFRQDASSEGSISVSGSTVSYNGFTGTHWSRLSDNSKPTILKGTILESLDEMCDWYQVQFDVTKTDDEGNEATITKKESYALGDGESVGDVITYNYEGTDYQATIIQEDDIKHVKSKISDTVDAKNVYGVFFDWDNDDDTVNDMLVAQTGTFVVRINGSETVSKGDLIQSNGDGTGKVQSDDLLRASTVAKVLSTTKIETYDDGSYIVPCSLHC